MSTLVSCQPPPPVGWASVVEYECRFVARPLTATSPSRSSVDSQRSAQIILASAGVRTIYEDTTVDRDGTLSQSSLFQSESLFIPTQESPWKKAWNTWWDHGLVQALEEFEADTAAESQEGLPTKLALYTLQYIRRLQALYGYISPQSKMSTMDLVSKYSPLVDWEHSVVRAIALHPRLPYIAIARQDEIIEIKSLNNSDHKVLLRDKKQVGVVCMQWAPHCNQLLAVGASTGVLLWNVDPTSPTTRFLTTWVRVESSPGHTPVTSISWSPHGNFLVSASPADYSLITWDIPMGVATRIRRSGGGGVTMVTWSPDGQRVFAGCASSMFRMWETQKWTCEKWTNTSGRCKAACWSPKGDILLFALEGDLSLYYICFRGNELAAGSTSAIKCADLTPCTLAGERGEEFIVGGDVQSLAWDPTGERLVVTFTADSPSSELVAILRTRTSHLLEILPGGFLRGEEGERPSSVEFKSGYSEGALLATAWSSGRISFTPLCFRSSISLTTPTFSPEQLTSLTSQPEQSLMSGNHILSSAHHRGSGGHGGYHGTLYSTEPYDSD